MKERPILFSHSMVVAILAGHKTMTRRVLKNQPQLNSNPPPGTCAHTFLELFEAKYPYEAGDQLWVKETHWMLGRWRKNGISKTGKQKWKFHGQRRVAYGPPSQKVGARNQMGWHKRPSIFMPRWASQITLEVTKVRMQRLQEITESDAMAEGVDPRQWICWKANMGPMSGTMARNAENAIESFHFLWDSLNAKRGFGWNKNPFVWVIEFRRIKP